MRPEFVDRIPPRAKKGRAAEEMDTIACRAPAEYKRKLEAFAYIEDDTLTGLVMEGLMRVIDNREADPVYMEEYRGVRERRIADLQAQFDELRAAKPLFGNPTIEQ